MSKNIVNFLISLLEFKVFVSNLRYVLIIEKILETSFLLSISISLKCSIFCLVLYRDLPLYSSASVSFYIILDQKFLTLFAPPLSLCIFYKIDDLVWTSYFTSSVCKSIKPKFNPFISPLFFSFGFNFIAFFFTLLIIICSTILIWAGTKWNLIKSPLFISFFNFIIILFTIY